MTFGKWRQEVSLKLASWLVPCSYLQNLYNLENYTCVFIMYDLPIEAALTSVNMKFLAPPGGQVPQKLKDAFSVCMLTPVGH